MFSTSTKRLFLTFETVLYFFNNTPKLTVFNILIVSLYSCCKFLVTRHSPFAFSLSHSGAFVHLFFLWSIYSFFFNSIQKDATLLLDRNVEKAQRSRHKPIGDMSKINVFKFGSVEKLDTFCKKEEVKVGKSYQF